MQFSCHYYETQIHPAELLYWQVITNYQAHDLEEAEV